MNKGFLVKTTTPFSELDLHPLLLESLTKAGFEKTSPIQDLTFIPIMDGKDIFAQAETGSGKTGAFAIPILQRLLTEVTPDQMGAGKPQYVVLSPTRELAQQTFSVFEKFSAELGITSACIIGGENINTQKQLLGKGLHVLVGTPGRIKDLIIQKEIFLTKCQGIVFDEADRLFDMGFKNDIEFILGKAPKERQLIMVSATSNLDVIRTAYKFHSNPEELRINHEKLLVDKIDHYLAMMKSNEKFPFLVKYLKNQTDTYAIIFCNTQYQTHSLAEWLIAMGFKAKPISGRLPQNKRTKLLEDFRSKKVTLLVCTDVAARGLDVKNVPLVVNYDLPNEAANYVHRIGRTGRAGEKGVAISLCAPEDCEYLDGIYEYIDAKIPKLPLTDDDFEKDICKRPFIDRFTLQVENNYNSPKVTKPTKPVQAAPVQKVVEKPAVALTKEIRTEPMPEIQKRNDKRFFEITTKSEPEAKSKALEFFRIKEEELLNFEITKLGKKAFIFFGPQTKTYKFSLKPNFHKILVPFIADIIKLAKLNLTINLTYQEPQLKIALSGSDEKLLTENGNELLFSFDHLIRLYLYQRIVLPFGMKIEVTTSKNKEDKGPQPQEAELVRLAQRLKKELLEKKNPVFTAALSPAERRIIHMQFQDDPQFKTFSLGDGRFKKMKICLNDK